MNGRATIPSPQLDAPTRVRWATGLISAAHPRQLLEVGCGGGHALSLLHNRFPNAKIVGIDRSALQVSRAKKRLALRESHANVSVEALSLSAAATKWTTHPFDVVLAINVNAFWTTPASAFESVRALLLEGGQLLLAYELPIESGLRTLEARVGDASAQHGWTPIKPPDVLDACIAFNLRRHVEQR